MIKQKIELLGANIFSLSGLAFYLTDIKSLLTVLVLVTALILNVKNILKKEK